jgi:hypothetical protein
MTPSVALLVDAFAKALQADPLSQVRKDTERELFTTAGGGNVQAKNAFVAALAAQLTPQCPDTVFGVLANTAGCLVEWGADPAIALSPVLDRLPQLFAKVPDLVPKLQEAFGTYNLDNVPEEQWRAAHSPEVQTAVKDFVNLRFASCAAMTMLARSVPLRIEARKREPLVNSAVAARDDNPYAYYISEVLALTDNLEMLAIDLHQLQGFRISLEGVRNNFHLFSLLQAQLLGRHPEQDASFDTAAWSFYQWPALQVEGERASPYEIPPGQMQWWVWGEMTPAEILRFKGLPVILLGAVEAGRSWGLEFCAPLHSALESKVVVKETLDGADLEVWLQRLRAGQ